MIIGSLEELIEDISCNNLYIYGAGKVAKELYADFNSLGIIINGFVVADKNDNPHKIGDKQVLALSEFDVQGDYKLIVGVGLGLRDSVIESLQNKGLSDLIVMDNKLTRKIVYRSSCEEKKLFFDNTDYELRLPLKIENGMALIAERDCGNNVVWRIELRNWNELIDSVNNGDLLKDRKLTINFKENWGEFMMATDIVAGCPENVDVNDELDVFAVKCHLDAPIRNADVRQYIHEIQAGAERTTKRIAEYRDNTGDNISDRNSDFSECTAIYWIWKNAIKKSYVGVYHYRRHLNIDDDTIRECIKAEVDVVNTVPSIVFPSVESFFAQYFITEKDLKLMEEAIQSIYPNYYEDALDYLGGPFYLANNIFIMKTEWFDRMCKFVFDILLYIDDYYREQNIERHDRYAGYLFEILYGLFVRIHSNELSIVYTDMYFLGCADV